jgi:hypothetical protein
MIQQLHHQVSYIEDDSLYVPQQETRYTKLKAVMEQAVMDKASLAQVVLWMCGMKL